MIAPALHAARQLAWHLRASRPLAPPDWLSRAESDLFSRMPPADQLEGLAVARSLAERGWGADRELLLAGALHDVGKSLAPAGARYRVVMTALQALAPSMASWLIGRSPTLSALADHPASGAELAAAAGLPSDVVRLIAGHHQPAQDARMAALQQADALR